MTDVNKPELSLKDRGKYFMKLDRLINELYYLSFIELMNQHPEIPRQHFFQVLNGERIDLTILGLIKAEVKKCELVQRTSC